MIIYFCRSNKALVLPKLELFAGEWGLIVILLKFVFHCVCKLGEKQVMYWYMQRIWTSLHMYMTVWVISLHFKRCYLWLYNCSVKSKIVFKKQENTTMTLCLVRCSLPARTSIIAAANPVGGHYSKGKTVLENLK